MTIELKETPIRDYSTFENVFLTVLNKHAPTKKKTFRANHKPYMTKTLRKAIMRRSALENKYFKSRTAVTKKCYQKQKNYTNKLLKKEKRDYFKNLNVNNFTDNKKIWNTVKPLFPNKEYGSQPITLVVDDDIICKEEDVAETFNRFFKNSIANLDISANRILQNVVCGLKDPADIAFKKFENHPSVMDIRKVVDTNSSFSLITVTLADIEAELKTTTLDIPVKHLKQVTDIILEPLMQIWNIEIIQNKKFPDKLKCAKKLE